ncbi:hypothetical protein [Streptomyces fuscichromogenes]|uniref:Uncharacterized protein n=1 Tax=Streptomyces fuscichromogenes TaxID=1324013 RepID=A0A917XHA7_9ACTN|nr:hypothetical protein [Streptomyces fuscichromogenes]GGN25123.1 hypothetical protein GCM10011578_058840 [Streptomyces fuscichromogenes]
MSPGRRRVTAGVGCLLSALVLAVLPLPRGADQARAATAGSSAVTRSGAKGVYGDDFSHLEVTVHQTKDLTGQGVRVTWTGGVPSGNDETNFLSIMQCWGDADSGPDRTQCEFGLAAGGQKGDGRAVYRGDTSGHDPLEADSSTPVDKNGTHYVPFRPVEGQGDATAGPTDTTYFTDGDTNADPFMPNDGDGGGDISFELKSAVEQPALGCGARTTSAGEIQPCWLVVVPRGTHDPNGQAHTGGAQVTSSISRSNWDQRIVFRLGFAPVTDNCDADKPERGIMGSELATDAITSWQSALCRTGTYRFNFTQSGEQQARSAVTSGDALAGLAMTVDPVEPVAGAAQVVHAPVAVTGLTIGFVWMYDATDGTRPLTKLRLNQRLLAKALTQSYPFSVVKPADKVPDYLSGNPDSLVKDPEFLRLNPDLAGQAAGNAPLGLAVSLANTDSANIVWKYILANTDAREFIEGKADPWGMKVNPAYEDGVVSDSLDFFPKADIAPRTPDCGGGSTVTTTYTGLDVVPYVNDMHDGALKVRRGDIGTAYDCVVVDNMAKLAPLGRPIPTRQRQFGVVDNASAVRYQLGAAALANADGDYVTPTEGSLLKAVAEMPDSDVAGVKAPAPAKMKDGAYPLTAVVYAASSLDQAEAARQDYAKVMRYAAGAGQTQGTAKGELPYGYAPLPAAMRTQARQAADRLEKGASAGDGSPGGTSSGGDDLSGTGSGGAAGGGVSGGTGATGGGSAGTSGAAAGGTGASDTPKPSAAPSGTDPAGQNVAQSGGHTPSEVLGLIRWVLLGVLVAGGAAALAGPVMLRFSVRGAASTHVHGGEIE